MVFRRLVRITSSIYRNNVQFISCSATIANPAVHMHALTGLPEDRIALIDKDSSPCGPRHHAIWNPPYKNELYPLFGRIPAINETSRLACLLIKKGIRTIIFCRVRRSCELLLKQIHCDLEKEDHLRSRVMGYRGGYRPEERRKIEKDMFQGKLLAIVATNALELGIDIGSLDAVLHMGFPFSMASYHQQCGRAGRRKMDSLSIMIADGDNQLDQHWMKRPRELFQSVAESVALDVNNELTLEGHLQCAAAESPFDLETDAEYFPGTLESIKTLCQTHLLRGHDGVFYANHKYEGYPAKSIPIRGIEEEYYRVVDVSTNQDLEELETTRAMFTVYEGGIFLHQGKSYLVTELNMDRRVAKVRPTNVEWTTFQRDFSDVDPIKTKESKAIANSVCSALYGDVQATITVFGYHKINSKTKKIIESVEDLQMPPFIIQSSGFWVDIPSSTVDYIRAQGLNIEHGIHAASHALMSFMPIFVMATGMSDVRTECKNPHATRPRPARIVIYDAKGKAGVAYSGYQQISNLMSKAKDMVEACPCVEGCPECGISRSTCSEQNLAISKPACLLLFHGIFGERWTTSSSSAILPSGETNQLKATK